MSEELRSKLGNLKVEKNISNFNRDNLAIALCTYFTDHMNRPENDPVTENGWGAWVEEKTDEALDLISEQLEL